MKLVTSIGGAGLVFALGYYAGQLQLAPRPAPQTATATTMPAAVHPPAVHARRDNVTDLLPPSPDLGAPFVPGPIAQFGVPPHEDLAPPSPAPEDIARQERRNADMIAAMRASHLPEEHIADMQEALAAQTPAGAAAGAQLPPQERSAAELAAELRASLEQAGAPQEAIDDMVQHMVPLTAAVQAQPLAPHARPAHSPRAD